jgi:hypothetical protein
MFVILRPERLGMSGRIEDLSEISGQSNQDALDSHVFCSNFGKLILESTIPTSPSRETSLDLKKSQVQANNLAISMDLTLGLSLFDDNLSPSEKILIQYRCSTSSPRGFDEHSKLYFRAEDISVESLIGVPAMPRSSCRVIDWHGTHTEIIDIIETGEWTQSRPFLAHLNSVTCLTTKNAIKRVLEIELDLKGSHITFLPGDAFGILPRNNSQLIHALMKRLQIHDPHRLVSLMRESQTFKGNSLSFNPCFCHFHHVYWILSTMRYPHFVDICSLSDIFFFLLDTLRIGIDNPSQRPRSLFDIFKQELDLTGVPRKALFRMIAGHTSSEEERRNALYLCSRQGNDSKGDGGKNSSNFGSHC